MPPLPLEDAALVWLDALADPGTALVGYAGQGGSEHAATAAAAATSLRILLGAEPEIPDVLAAPDAESQDPLYWYFGALASYQLGDEAWEAWAKAQETAVIGRQRSDTDACRYLGSWDPEGPWARAGGRVAATAVYAMALEASYRYPRVVDTR